MSINLKAKETKLHIGSMSGQYRFIMQAETYSTLTDAKIFKEAALRSGLSKGLIKASWDAIGDVVSTWATEGHSVPIPGLGHMRFGIRASSVEKVEDVSTKLITSRRIIFTPSVSIKQELADTRISITCYDRNGQVIKTVTSADKDDVEDGDEDEGDVSNDPGNGGNATGGNGNQQTGGLTQEPEKYRITFKFSDNTEDDHEYSAGETINYPTPTSGYRWPDSKPSVMPAQNISVTEVAIAQGGTGNQQTGGGGGTETYTATLHIGSYYSTLTGEAGSPLDLPQLESGYVWPSNMPTVMPAQDFTAYAIEGEQNTTDSYTLTIQHQGETLRTEQLHADDIVFLGTAPDGYKWSNTPRYGKMPARDWTVSTQAV